MKAQSSEQHRLKDIRCPLRLVKDWRTGVAFKELSAWHPTQSDTCVSFQGDRRALLISLAGIGLGAAAVSKLLPQSSTPSSRRRRTTGTYDPWTVLFLSCHIPCNMYYSLQ